jgi:Translationally controlled tumour protein
MPRKKIQDNGATAESLTAFTDGVHSYAQPKILPKFKHYIFNLGNSNNEDGMITLTSYREDDITPYVFLWKDGLKELRVCYDLGPGRGDSVGNNTGTFGLDQLRPP